MLYKTFQLFSSSAGEGGLFDFGLTLPLMALQFLALMVILDSIFYSPLILAINQREEYIQLKLKKAGELIKKANHIKMTTEQEIILAEQVSQINISKCTKETKKKFDDYLKVAQHRFSKMLEKANTSIRYKKAQDLIALKAKNEAEISKQIVSILLAYPADIIPVPSYTDWVTI
jgi:F-type H+-transporting ATPase subunit b